MFPILAPVISEVRSTDGTIFKSSRPGTLSSPGRKHPNPAKTQVSGPQGIHYEKLLCLSHKGQVNDFINTLKSMVGMDSATV